jgi:hypothetical protein
LTFIGLAEGRRRHEAAALLKAVLPEFGAYLVIARVGHALGRIAIAQQDEAAAAQDEFARAVFALLDDRRDVAREDRRQRIEHRDAVVR